MNNLDEIKKRLAYAENNNLFQAHYINDMNFLIEKNKSYLEACSKLTQAIDSKDQAIINVSVEFTKFLKLNFHAGGTGYPKLKGLIEELISIPGMDGDNPDEARAARPVGFAAGHLSTESSQDIVRQP